MAYFRLGMIDRTGEEAPAAAAADVRITPDPLSAVLPALAALGSIASIAAINWIGGDKASPVVRRRRKVSAAVRDLESDCLKLQEIFRRLMRIYRTHAPDEEARASAISRPMKFGHLGLELPGRGFEDYQAIVTDVGHALITASQNSFDVMAAIEDGEITAPDEIFLGFAAEQERLNEVLLKREPLKGAAAVGLSVAEALTGLVKDLKRHTIE